MAEQAWKVYHSGNFWGHEKGERRCKEIVVEKNFTWGGQNWRMPSVYTCPKGLVIDFCAEVPADEVRAFMEKWNLWDGEREDYTDEEVELLDAENPLSFRITPVAYVNGKELQGSHGCSVSWHPCPPDGIEREPEAKALLQYYHCDPEQGWVFIRYAFWWTRPEAEGACGGETFPKRKNMRTPVIHDMKVILRQEAVSVAGEHFCTECAGCEENEIEVAENGAKAAENAGLLPSKEFEFVHPVTKARHRLVVSALEKVELPTQTFSDCGREEGHRRWVEDVEWPGKYIQMQYTLTPDLSNQEISVVDCARCDQPRKRAAENEDWSPDGDSVRAAAISVIGGAGPTSLFLCGKGEQNTHLACSAPHFEWVKQVEWRMIFYRKDRKDKEVFMINSSGKSASLTSSNA